MKLHDTLYSKGTAVLFVVDGKSLEGFIQQASATTICVFGSDHNIYEFSIADRKMVGNSKVTFRFRQEREPQNFSTDFSAVMPFKKVLLRGTTIDGVIVNFMGIVTKLTADRIFVFINDREAVFHHQYLEEITVRLQRWSIIGIATDQTEFV